MKQKLAIMLGWSGLLLSVAPEAQAGPVDANGTALPDSSDDQLPRDESNRRINCLMPRGAGQ